MLARTSADTFFGLAVPALLTLSVEDFVEGRTT
jgi:hypothetical protein